MPLIQIKYFENEFSDDERAGIIGAVTDAMAAFTGESIRPHTWVVLEEIKNGNWGIGAPRSAAPTSAHPIARMRQPGSVIGRQRREKERTP